MSDRPASVIISTTAVRRLRRGNLWVYDTDILRLTRDGELGSAAVVYDEKREMIGAGLWDPTSPIRVRMLSVGKGVAVGAPLFAERLRDAHEHRQSFIGDDTTGYRVVHGENDALPGLVVDRYGDVAVIKVYAAAWLPWLDGIVAQVAGLLESKAVVVRSSRAVAAEGAPDGVVAFGTLPEPVEFLENGLLFGCDPIRGQKTGFFLDQRDNRARVGAESAGKRVLNVFAYSGGFSVYAARGGATEVTSVDLSAPALADADANFARNAHIPAVAACRHRTVAGDAFAIMRDMAASKELFDIVIVDPPSFAKQSAEVERAVVSYRRLASLGLALVAPHGLLVAASCSSRVSPEQFGEALDDELGVGRRKIRLEDVTGHAPDHPVVVPGSMYLKARWYRRT
jgi:23S rRNA (cytosine1962-C5)-methyltransferase